MTKFLTYAELDVTEPEDGIIQFEMKAEHIKLLRNSLVAWSCFQAPEMGRPEINSVRPYGTNNVIGDMQHILEGEVVSRDALERLHKQTALALQIILKTGKMRPGIFRAPKYSQDWKEYKPKKVKDNGQIAVDSSED